MRSSVDQFSPERDSPDVAPAASSTRMTAACRQPQPDRNPPRRVGVNVSRRPAGDICRPDACDRYFRENSGIHATNDTLPLQFAFRFC